MNENITLTGKVLITLTNDKGEILKEEIGDNLVVTTGKNFVASALIAASGSPFTHIAVGSSSTPAALANTTLGTEITRVAAAVSNPTTTTALFSATYGAGIGTGSIEEVGIFNNSSGGTMFSRYLTGTYLKSINDTLTVSWTITVA